MPPFSLAPSFLSALPFKLEEGTSEPALESVLLELLGDCRSAWPGVGLEPADFMRYLAERLAPAQDLRIALTATSVTDLYLACACALGDPQAVAALDSTYIKRIASASFGAVPRVRDAEELAQRLRVRLLVGEAEQPPRLASYSGRGPLSAWLRVAAARLAVDLHRAETAEVPPTWVLRALPVDQELLYLKQAHAELFAATLEAALDALTKRSRTVLRLHFLEGVPITQISTSYSVSARSVQRWIVAAQTEVVEYLRSALAAQLELSSSQLESLIGVMETELVIALRQFFTPKS